jgi:glyoxylase-like metal-dependent hydrolase (beta-lactamase superfamily II)
LADTAQDVAVLIDPGDEGSRLVKAVTGHGFTLEAIWLTHAHFDHVGAIADLKEVWDVPVYLHPAELPILAQAAQAAARWEIAIRQPPTETRPLAPGQILTLGGLRVYCLFVPGHSPGHMAFHLPREELLISGDVLFRGSIGRTDLPGGDHGQLLNSIRRELLTLPEATRVYPGHGPATTIGAEKRSNPFLR